jgi:hypothetical protein
MTSAFTRLASLRNHAVLTEAEYQVAREAMLGAVDGVSAGRSVRVDIYRSLTKAGMALSADGAQDRLLGLPYVSAPERWDELLTRLESLHEARQTEHLSPDEFESVKYGILGRLHWLELVGKLVWELRDVDGLELWHREDGWGVSNDTFQETMRWLYRRTPYEASPTRGEHVHEYIDWVTDQCWLHYNELIVDGDVVYLRRLGLRRVDSGLWSFDAGDDW